MSKALRESASHRWNFPDLFFHWFNTYGGKAGDVCKATVDTLWDGFKVRGSGCSRIPSKSVLYHFISKSCSLHSKLTDVWPGQNDACT